MSIQKDGTDTVYKYCILVVITVTETREQYVTH